MKKRRIAIVALMALVATSGVVVTGTFARYKDSVNGQSEASIAKWKVLVNDEDIHTSDTLNQSMPLTVISDSTKVAAGKMAPGTSGYFDITIDTSDTEVATKFSIALNGTPELGRIEIAGYNVSTTAFTSESSIPTGLTQLGVDSANNTIGLSQDKGQKKYVRVYVQWNNDDANNTIDTEAGTTAGTVSIPLSITVQQDI